MELLTQLGIDWKLLAAQIVNFAVLVGLLGWLVYKPLLKLLDERSARIQRAMEQAKRAEQQEKEMHELRLAELKRLDQESGNFLRRGKEQPEQAKLEILSGARLEAASMLEKAKQQMEEQRRQLLTDVQQAAAALILRATEKIVARTFGPDDQQRLLSTIAQELPSLAHAHRS